jgi:hypothetical protein
MNQANFWDRFTAAEEKVEKDNAARVQAALSDLNIISMDMAYSHRDYNDEAMGRSHLLHATLADGTKMNLETRYGEVPKADDPAFSIKSAVVEVESVGQVKSGAEMTMVHTKTNCNLIEAIRGMELIEEDFMTSHGARSVDSDYGCDDDSDEDRSPPVIHEGKVRIRVMDMKPQPLDDQGNVIQPRRSAYGRW